jgi:hypothetical protein
MYILEKPIQFHFSSFYFHLIPKFVRWRNSSHAKITIPIKDERFMCYVNEGRFEIIDEIVQVKNISFTILQHKTFIGKGWKFTKPCDALLW